MVDIGLPGKSGLEFIKEIRAMKTASKLLAVSMFDEAVYAQRVLRAGGDGYIMKQEDPEEIVHAIRDVLAGHIYVSENVFSRDSSTQPSPIKTGFLDLLTDAELDVLESLGKGKSKAKISVQSGSSKVEIQTHIENIRRKLKFKSEKSLTDYAISWVKSSQEAAWGIDSAFKISRFNQPHVARFLEPGKGRFRVLIQSVFRKPLNGIRTSMLTFPEAGLGFYFAMCPPRPTPVPACLLDLSHAALFFPCLSALESNLDRRLESLESVYLIEPEFAV